MSIRGALDRIVTIQGGLSIADPVKLSVKKAWKYIPPQNKTLPETPAWMNAWRFVEQERISGLRSLQYSVNMRLAAADAMVEQNRGADIATAFWEAAFTAFDGDIRLGNTAVNSRLRSEGPTLVVIEFGGKTYIGLDLWLDVEIASAAQ